MKYLQQNKKALILIFSVVVTFLFYMANLKQIHSLYLTNLSSLSMLKGNTSHSFELSKKARELGFINSGQWYHQYMLDHQSIDIQQAFLMNPMNVNYIFLFADETILKEDWHSSRQHFNKIPFARYLARRGVEIANDKDPIQAKKGLYYLCFSRKILPEAQISSSLGSIFCFTYKVYQKGEPLLWYALKSNPKNLSYYENLANMYVKKNNFVLSRSILELGRRINNTNVKFLTSIGQSFVRDEKIKESFSYFILAKKIAPKNSQVNYLLAKTYEKQKEYFLAEIEYLEAISQNPSDFGPRFEWGVALYQRQDYKRAITQFTVASTLKPDHVWSYYYRSICYMNEKNYTKAKNDIDTCLTLEPKNEAFLRKKEQISEILEEKTS